MAIRSLILAAGLIAASTSAGFAAAPVLRVTKTMDIPAPPAKVWGVIAQFADMTWVPPVKSSTATQGNAPGSVRTLDLGGPRLVEELKTYDGPGMSYAYVITPAPANVQTLPVTGYAAVITVTASATGSLVTWSGSFHRADPGDAPAATMNDAAALAAVGGVYDAGLGGLRARATAP